MKYAFLFSFYIDPPNGPVNESDVHGLEAGFLVEGEALAALLPATISKTGWDEDYNGWVEDTAGELEEVHNAVHNPAGTSCENDLCVESFHTYEIDNEQDARRLMENWRNAFLERVGNAKGVGILCVIDRAQVNTLVPGYSNETAQEIELLEKLSSPGVKAGARAKP